MNKLVRDGMVAVLYSPDYGSGWYTWNRNQPELLFDPAIVQLVEEDKFDELKTYVTLKYPNIYEGGMWELKVAWIPEGAMFRINEYDGDESIELKDDMDWFTA
mgnify:CR=1 FL=1|jgi:hypothetical protein